jgi:pimeloyl-ACP methyl ester carboxylesterase
MSWAFHYDDVDPDFVAYDLSRFDRPVTEVATQVTTKCPPWGSLAIPAHVAQLCLTPGSIAPEAAAVMVPVLVAMGERDVIADPKSEGRAYQSATSVDLFICPRMGHMHNFASTRELFWRRLEIWAEWVRESKKVIG